MVTWTLRVPPHPDHLAGHCQVVERRVPAPPGTVCVVGPWEVRGAFFMEMRKSGQGQRVSSVGERSFLLGEVAGSGDSL